MGNIWAIFKKQCKDTFKNKTILIQFVMFPVLTLIMNNVIVVDGMPDDFFVNLFATMYIGMTPLTSMAAVIAEEKEKNTLRVLLMSNVKPYEYLLGVGSYIWLACMIGAAIICAAGGYSLQERLAFMAIMAIGILASLLIGAAIGTWSKTQMMATSMTVPVMMIFSFMPMLSMFNTTIAKVAKFIYSEQISIMLNQISALQLEVGNICIIVTNMLLFVALFTIAYKRCGFE
ncbi:MAG: ABC transporter permease [Lachnospiraceae bacterium]|nr:ABC transporter permease [Lachnospiraceae bacterium]